jgi:integrase
LSVYRRGKTWWYSFVFCGQYIQESAKTKSKTVAKEAEKTRRRELEEGYNNITPEDRNRRILTLAKAAEEYQEQYEARNTANATRYSEYCIKHLVEHLGSKMLIQITDHAVVAYQQARLKEGAAGKTINEEVGELFRIMGSFGEAIRLKLKRAKKLKLTEREDVGRALSADEERNVLAQARASESPHIYSAVVIALNTGLRDSEIRFMQWRQIDLFKQILTVGKSKTAEGTGRTIPLNSEMLKVLAQHQNWYEKNVGKATGDHFVFPKGAHNRFDAKKPVTSFKTAWNRVRREAKVSARFHDLRHTLITKLAESGAGDETIMGIAGHVSRRMLSRYAHIRTEAKRKALESIVRAAVPIPVPENQAGQSSEHVVVN